MYQMLESMIEHTQNYRGGYITILLKIGLYQVVNI